VTIIVVVLLLHVVKHATLSIVHLSSLSVVCVCVCVCACARVRVCVCACVCTFCMVFQEVDGSSTYAWNHDQFEQGRVGVLDCDVDVQRGREGGGREGGRGRERLPQRRSVVTPGSLSSDLSLALALAAGFQKTDNIDRWPMTPSFPATKRVTIAEEHSTCVAAEKHKHYTSQPAQTQPHSFQQESRIWRWIHLPIML
jgi:hypothetical protein